MYKSLAHPGLMGYVGPVTLEERLMHIREARRTLGSEIPWLCDTMSNDLKHAIGDASNSEFVLNPQGAIVRLRDWSRPAILRKDLEELVGPVERPTLVSDLNLKVEPANRTASTGVVPMLEFEGEFMPLSIEPQIAISKSPFYAKLRAEGDRGVLNTGKGKVYVGLFLDPIHHVHWNNRVAPVQYSLNVPKGVSVNPMKGQAPRAQTEEDADPREFLLEVNGWQSTAPIGIQFRYYACTDDWCKLFAQEYLIHLKPDRDGGRQFRAGELDVRELDPPQR